MARLRCSDLPTKLKLSTNKRAIEKYKRETAKKKKLEKALDKIKDGDGVISVSSEISDRIEELIDEDLDEMEDDIANEEYFLDELASISEIPIQSTGTRWYHHRKPLGKFFGRIRESNDDNNRTTIIIVRGVNEDVYRLSVRRSKEIGVLHQLVQEGYILSKVKITSMDK